MLLIPPWAKEGLKIQLLYMCRGAGSNRRPHPLQGYALPTELPRQNANFKPEGLNSPPSIQKYSENSTYLAGCCVKGMNAETSVEKVENSSRIV